LGVVDGTTKNKPLPPFWIEDDLDLIVREVHIPVDAPVGIGPVFDEHVVRGLDREIQEIAVLNVPVDKSDEHPLPRSRDRPGELVPPLPPDLITRTREKHDVNLFKIRRLEQALDDGKRCAVQCLRILHCDQMIAGIGESMGRGVVGCNWRTFRGSIRRSMQASTRTEHRLGVIRIQDELPNFARHLSTCRMGGDELAGNLKFAT